MTLVGKACVAGSGGKALSGRKLSERAAQQRAPTKQAGWSLEPMLERPCEVRSMHSRGTRQLVDSNIGFARQTFARPDQPRRRRAVKMLSFDARHEITDAFVGVRLARSALSENPAQQRAARPCCGERQMPRGCRSCSGQLPSSSACSLSARASTFNASSAPSVTKACPPPARRPNSSSSASGRLIDSWMTRAIGRAPIFGS